MKKTKILLSGWFDLGPIGRHGLSFMNTLQINPQNEIYLDSDYVSQENLKKIIPNLDDKKIHFSNKLDEEFDFLIYFHVLGTKPSEELYAKALEKKTKIKICYPVFDGTVPPLEWIEKINNNFDICCSPSEYVTHNLRRYGVKIDSFGLECCVLIDDFLKCSHKKTKKFRFGCISGNESRKNLKFLVEAFSEAFSKNDPVELFIHSVDRPNLLTPFEELQETVKKANEKSNVILHSDFVSQKAMNKIWNSFDCYVIPQRNTGYYTTPLEGIACGIPCILSDIPVHREFKGYIQSKNNLFFVEHPNFVSEYHFVFDYRNIGVSFASFIELYKKAFKNLYKNRDKLYSENLVLQRKKAARKFLPEYLTHKHNLLIHPQKIALAKKTSHIDTKQGVFFMSKALAKKYEQYGWGKIENISDTYIEKVYPEESSPIFKALEQCAVDTQKIWLKQESAGIILSHSRMRKLLSKAEKYQIKDLPNFIYKQFSLYCKIKGKRKK